MIEIFGISHQARTLPLDGVVPSLKKSFILPKDLGCQIDLNKIPSNERRGQSKERLVK